MALFNGEKILVVEDNFISFKLVEAYLSRRNLELIHATTGLQALELYKKNPEIGLILMDIQLPGMNGLDTTKKIREFDTEVPVIAATANVFDDDRIACSNAGCTDFVSKPINFDKLIEMLHKYLG